MASVLEQVRDAAKARLIFEIGGSEKERKTFAARRRDILLAFRMATKKRIRMKLFFKLWVLNVRNRDVALANLVALTFTFPSEMDRILGTFVTNAHFQEVPARERIGALLKSRGKRPARLPTVLDSVTPRVFYSVTNMLRVILDTNLRGQVKWTGAMMALSKETVARVASYQILMALLETVMSIIFSGEDGKLGKKDLVKVAKEMEIQGVDKMNKDQLQIAVAQGLVQLASEARG